MKSESYKIDHSKWGHVIFLAQLLIAICVLITEIVDNILLYVTRSQGYGPDTIVQKLIRYLLVTTIINFGLILINQIVARRNKDIETVKFVFMLCTTLICTNVAFTHYQFASALVIFIVPILVSILYEDASLTLTTLVLTLTGQTVAVLARAIDPVYNKDIGPEAAITYVFTIGVYIISRIITNTLRTRRHELGIALVDTEKANAAVERAKLSLKMLETLARAIDAKDKYTNGHSTRVAIYSTILAKALGWDDKRIEMLKYEALLHDIGKIGVPDTVLNKPDRLSASEFNIIKSHTLVGADILKDMVAVPNANDVAKHHHERFDGSGYPSGLKGDMISINARIVCIADAYDAMSSDRIYRKALSESVIRRELVNGRGTQFDPELLDVFLTLFDERRLVITSDVVSLTERDSTQEYIMEDIERVIRNLSVLEEQSNSGGNDFDKFYKYMRNIGIRYNRTIEVLSVTILPKTDCVPLETQEAVAEEMEVAIRKNIRSVDVYYRHSDFKHMIIFLDAGRENMEVITQRISFDFNTNKYTSDYELTFDVNENIKSLEDVI